MAVNVLTVINFFNGQPYLVHSNFGMATAAHLSKHTKYLDSVSSECLATFVKVIYFQEQMPLSEHSPYRPC
jgi:hypothetical protein